MSTLEVGLVKWYGGYNYHKKEDNKFGFIERIEPNEDIFVYEKNLLCDYHELYEKMVVIFEVRENRKKGKNEAIKVRKPNFNNEEEWKLCAESKNEDIWFAALEKMESKLTAMDENTAEYLIEKLTELSQNRRIFDLEDIVEQIPDEAFYTYSKLRDFLESERYIQILSDLYTKSDNIQIKNQLKEDISKKLEYNYRFIYSQQAVWTPVRSREEIKWIVDNYKSDTWDVIPFEVIVDEKIWSKVPDHKKYSVLLKQLNLSSTKEGKKQIFQKIVETAKKETNHYSMPEGLKSYKEIFPLLNSIEQVKISWFFIKEYWNLMNRDAKIRAAYRAAKENQNLVISDYFEGENDLLVKAVLFLLGRKLGKSAPLVKAHNWITEYVTQVAWKSTKPLDLGPLLPGCPVIHSLKYCEARRWPTKDGKWKMENNGSELAYCPRKHSSCKVNTPQDLRGAHIHGIPDISWENWTLTDFFKALDIVPNTVRMNKNDTYLLKIAGWVNRLNEIRERMKCEYCGKILIPDKKYAFNPAGYNSTVARCPVGHGKGIYFNHCSNKDCNYIIDSRESAIKADVYHICIQCGDIPKYFRDKWDAENPFYYTSPFKQGDKCPKCGKNKMLDVPNKDGVKECSSPTCRHRIYLKGRKLK
ncbi:cold shock domain-containing protein [Priestia aryabhattai]|uniref:cold shock domain-containing protein n=1 Tax=Priestia aryabhattai TaxID=412384 RepID=UPI0020402A95|nr:cold shock domain-containing protein [Priestia aryabhattai]MCM3255579.1 cold shock domain-containing protein [Priestia aryabhattai]